MDGKDVKRKVVLEHLVHDTKRCIALNCPYDTDLIAAAKKAGATWSASHKRWYVLNAPEHLQAIFAAFKGVAWVDMNGLRKKPEAATGANSPGPRKSQGSSSGKAATQAVPLAPTISRKEATSLNPPQAEALAAMQRKLEVARYSANTIGTYLNATKHFFLHFPQKQPKDISTADIEAYQHELASTRKVSNSYLNQVVNAVRYYYKDVLGDAYRVKFIERPRGERKLPKVLSEQEVAAILRAPTNLKHRCILMLIYSAGLRLGELIALERTDIIPERKQVLIRGGKGGKDRVSLLSDKLLLLLDEYLRTYEPHRYLFEGPNGAKYSDTSVQQVFKQAKNKAGITAPATVHTLRHSFATHLRYIQALLGHASSKTTETCLPSGRSIPMSAPKRSAISAARWITWTSERLCGFTLSNSGIVPTTAVGMKRKYTI
jgi:site-specific recombinase XerD